MNTELLWDAHSHTKHAAAQHGMTSHTQRCASNMCKKATHGEEHAASSVSAGRHWTAHRCPGQCAHLSKFFIICLYELSTPVPALADPTLGLPSLRK